MRHLHAVFPDSVHDAQRPSGGNTYDRRLAAELPPLGWTVEEHLVAEAWPEPDASFRVARRALQDVTAALPNGGIALVDGLLASGAPEVMVPLAQRLRLVVLVHLPLEGPRERATLSAADAVIATSAWARRRLLELHDLDPRRVHVAEPGVDRGPVAAGTQHGGELLCVAAVIPTKGHDVLAGALAELTSLPWRCVVAGSLDRDPAFAERVAEQARTAGIADRVRFVGPLDPPALEEAYAAADVLVHPSRIETYGMVVTEALAHGLPVIATSVGGIPHALGHAAATSRVKRGVEGGPEAGLVGGSRPGLLVDVDDPSGLAAALAAWLSDPSLRRRLRRHARARRLDLTSWAGTGAQVSGVLDSLLAR